MTKTLRIGGSGGLTMRFQVVNVNLKKKKISVEVRLPVKPSVPTFYRMNNNREFTGTINEFWANVEACPAPEYISATAFLNYYENLDPYGKFISFNVGADNRFRWRNWAAWSWNYQHKMVNPMYFMRYNGNQNISCAGDMVRAMRVYPYGPAWNSSTANDYSWSD